MVFGAGFDVGTNATILKDVQTTLANATLVIREGKVVAVGNSVTIPKDAEHRNRQRRIEGRRDSTTTGSASSSTANDSAASASSGSSSTGATSDRGQDDRAEAQRETADTAA